MPSIFSLLLNTVLYRKDNRNLSSLRLLCIVPGGMGTAYSLPRSPDDYLSNVDEMDLQEDCKYTVRHYAGGQ